MSGPPRRRGKTPHYRRVIGVIMLLVGGLFIGVGRSQMSTWTWRSTSGTVHSCTPRVTSPVETVAVYLGLLDADFEVSEPPELVERLRLLVGRYQRALAAKDR